jgi:hypothetical protein
MRRTLCAVLLALGSSALPAQDLGGIGSAGAETDADRFTAVRLRAGGLAEMTSPWHYVGVAAQNTTYAQPGWRRNVPGVVGVWRDQARDTLAGVNVEAGAVEVAGRVRPVGDLSWALLPTAGTRIELLAAAGLVETQQAIDAGIGYTFFGASVEHTLAERVTAIVLAGYQPFTDGNDRVHLRARLVFDALPEDGINLQARWRQYVSSTTDVGGAYFDPQRYQQWLALVGMRQRVSGWIVSGAAGAGREYIYNDGTVMQPAYLAELRIEGPIGDGSRLALQALYNRSAGFSNAPDYWWGLLNVTLVVPF